MLRSCRLAATALAFGYAAPAIAQTGSSDRVLRSFQACRAIAEPTPRLACFEKATTDLETAVKTKEVTLVDRQDIRKAKRSLFGFTLPKIDLFGGNDRDEGEATSFTEINSTVASARSVANGRAEIRLADDNGAVWQTTDPMPFPPKAGAKIRIRQGSLGNYFLAVEGRSYRGMRLR